ncbi:MAG: hypothetical protein HY748_06255 [Elusimicrobia bacterium]|nr:hypothetical protein [Elusimicrobiota bacterium]
MMEWLMSWWRKQGRPSTGRARHDSLEEVLAAAGGPRDPDSALKDLHRKFAHFTGLLERNNQVLKTMSDMEEKAGGEYFFDINYVRAGLDGLRRGVAGMIEDMVALGGADYAVLRGRLAAIDREIEGILPGSRSVEKDEFVIPLESLGRDRDWSVGAKCAGLGEMKSRLGLPVPEGFAVSAWAYKHFLEANALRERVAGRIQTLDARDFDDLARAGAEIREMILSSPVPEDLAGALRTSADALARRSPSGRFSVRSSALGEDASLSFAGQYATFLNVGPGEVVDRYREVLASKFTPKAIYYFLSHALSETRLAMGVGLISMVDALASGVVYTRDPVSPDDGCALVSAVWGQGQYLVDGTLTPDSFRVSREDLSIKRSKAARKPFRLVLRPEGGIAREEVPAPEIERFSIGEGQVQELVRMALAVEGHYEGPRDIEWALDRNGRLFLLQNRPLRVFQRKAAPSLPDLSRLQALRTGGTTVCPGAGAGPLFFASSPEELARVPDGAVLAVSHPFPQISAVMGRLKSIVTAVGSMASHLATLAREYRVPTVVLDWNGLEEGRPVTVDATGGAVYAGLQEELIRAREAEFESPEEDDIIALTKRVLGKVSPLHLVHPADPDFTPRNCRTLHDITRLCHQRAMEEMFSSGEDIKEKDQLGLKLESAIPLPVTIIYLDPDLSAACRGKKSVGEGELGSEPMKAFWAGVRKEGWPKPPAASAKGLMSVIGAHQVMGGRPEFLEKSYALLGREYMLLSLRMGYHFTTVEALCAAEMSKNYIRMQYKQGGASLGGRMRRIRLIETLLGRLGFESLSRGDFLDTRISYQSREDIASRLHALGRLAIMTKQLDMALGNDRILEWYVRDFSAKLGLDRAGEAGS